MLHVYKNAGVPIQQFECYNGRSEIRMNKEARVIRRIIFHAQAKNKKKIKYQSVLYAKKNKQLVQPSDC